MSRKYASPPHYKVGFYIAYKSEDSPLNIGHVTKLVKTLSFLQDKDSECWFTIRSSLVDVRFIKLEKKCFLMIFLNRKWFRHCYLHCQCILLYISTKFGCYKS